MNLHLRISVNGEPALRLSPQPQASGVPALSKIRGEGLIVLHFDGLDDMASIQWPAARELRDTMLCHRA
jgi:hypothetical protein